MCRLLQIRERALPLLRDSQAMLPPLEEMEKNITGFYQSLEKASRITSSRDSESPGDFNQKCQVTHAVKSYDHTALNVQECLEQKTYVTGSLCKIH